MERDCIASIEFSDVWKGFKTGFQRKTVLKGISLSIGKGEIYGFLGPNGAGKSTAIKILMNFIRQDKGVVMVEGLNVRNAQFQDRIGYLPETACFYENLTGLETLRFAGMASNMKREATLERSRATLDLLDLSVAGSMPVRTYSKGMKQRLGLALALIHEPGVYILDEPMSGLDPLGRRLVIDVISRLKSGGKTVFFSSHILSDIERVCDRLGVINRGELLYSGSVRDFSAGGKGIEDAFITLIESHGRPKDV